MFGKVNVLLLTVFGTILGVQLFWNWDAPEAPKPSAAAPSVLSGPVTAEDYAPAFPAPEPQGERTASTAPIVTDLMPAEVEAGPETLAPSTERGAEPSVAAETEAAGSPVAPPATGGPAIDPVNPEIATPSARTAPVESERASAPAASGLLVTYAETLSIRFHGYTEISGSYRVNDDDTVSIPVIDRVSVAGLTGAELEAELAQKVFELTGRRSDVTIEVERYQPVFVSGAVARPGSFAWRRNMTIMHAVALSGGLYRSPERAKTGVGLIDAKLDIEKTLAELKRSITRSARLKAERDDVDTIDVPERLIALAGDAEARALIEGEQALLIASRSAAALELDAVEASLRAARDEVVRLQEFSVTLEAKLEERRKFLDKMIKVAAEGFATEERLAELHGQVIDLETRVATVRVSISQAEAARLALERDRIKLVQTRAAKVSEELLALESTIAEKTLAYEAALARRGEMVAGIDADAIAAQDNPDAVIFTVVRQTAFGIETIRVEAFEKLLPGDIVMIESPKLSPDGTVAETSFTGVN